jgi:hypothetical protein
MAMLPNARTTRKGIDGPLPALEPDAVAEAVHSAGYMQALYGQDAPENSPSLHLTPTTASVPLSSAPPSIHSSPFGPASFGFYPANPVSFQSLLDHQVHPPATLEAPQSSSDNFVDDMSATSNPTSQASEQIPSGRTPLREHCQMCHATSRALQGFLQRLGNVEQCISFIQQQRFPQAIQAQHFSAAANSAFSSTSLHAGPLGSIHSSKSSLSSQNGNPSVKSVPRSEFDRFLLPFLERSAKLSDADLESAVQICLLHFPECSRDELKSRIREWFRKHREYMTHRIDTHGKKNYRLRTRQEVMAELADIRNIDRIRQECSLELKADQEAREYVLERVSSYFDRRERTERRRGSAPTNSNSKHNPAND